MPYRKRQPRPQHHVAGWEGAADTAPATRHPNPRQHTYAVVLQQYTTFMLQLAVEQVSSSGASLALQGHHQSTTQSTATCCVLCSPHNTHYVHTFQASRMCCSTSFQPLFAASTRASTSRPHPTPPLSHCWPGLVAACNPPPPRPTRPPPPLRPPLQHRCSLSPPLAAAPTPRGLWRTCCSA